MSARTWRKGTSNSAKIVLATLFSHRCQKCEYRQVIFFWMSHPSYWCLWCTCSSFPGSTAQYSPAIEMVTTDRRWRRNFYLRRTWLLNIKFIKHTVNVLCLLSLTANQPTFVLLKAIVQRCCLQADIKMFQSSFLADSPDPDVVGKTTIVTRVQGDVRLKNLTLRR